MTSARASLVGVEHVRVLTLSASPTSPRVLSVTTDPATLPHEYATRALPAALELCARFKGGSCIAVA